MGYPVLPVRDIEGALFRQVNGRTAFRSRAIADAVLGEAAEAYQEACAGVLQRPRDWPDSLPLPPDAQRVVCGAAGPPGAGLATRRGGCWPPCAPASPASPATRRRRWCAPLAGLAAAEPAFVDERQRYIAGGRWQDVFAAYDALPGHGPRRRAGPALARSWW